MAVRRIDRFHPLSDVGETPERLNDPFDYEPHPLCRRAAKRLSAYIARHREWHDELARGKMLGVLVVRDNRGRTGFLAAFSGNLAGTNDLPYFVPPVYDMLASDGFFRLGEAEISDINRRTEALEHAPERIRALEHLRMAEDDARRRLGEMREAMQRNKALRDARRHTADDAALLEAIDNESRREKSAYRRLKAEVRKAVDAAREVLSRFDTEIESLKAERRRRSEELQVRLFDNFKVSDRFGRRRSLREIFTEATGAIPPAGAGECAAPKLLQYAFLNELTPLAIAEFWHGESPKGEIRRHGSYYPACRGKCKPILDYMLRGVETERRPTSPPPEPTVLYEDDCMIVVEKPAGMLSVDGRSEVLSAESWARRRFPEAADVRAAHRLDMPTSGLLLLSKDTETYRRLQEQFAGRKVHKRYIALLEGETAEDEGCIDLPLRPDPSDRPRQVTDREHGKPARTLYKVLGRCCGRTLISFEPVTGRTHQLRVHSAAAEGLNCPILGDVLYGAQPAERLYLHNEYIAFTHPYTGGQMQFLSPAPQSFTTTSESGLRGRSSCEAEAEG